MRSVLLLALIFIVASASLGAESMSQCFSQAKAFHLKVKKAIEQRDLDKIIDSFETILEEVPSLLETCGAQELAQNYEQQLSSACLKILARQAKILVEIMRLSAEDKDKNQKAILILMTAFQTIYRTQAQNKCPFLKEHDLLQAFNKGACAEGVYRLSLTFQTVDNDLLNGKFNQSLTDMAKVIEELTFTLDDCNQNKVADAIRIYLPEQCTNAIGGLIREVVTVEHHYTHLQWLQKHLKDFTKAIIKVHDACPALAHKK